MRRRAEPAKVCCDRLDSVPVKIAPKLVLDVDVLVAGMLFAGPARRILRLFRDGNVVVGATPSIAGVYRRVAQRVEET